MPNLVSEITEGVGFSYSSEQGQIAVAQPRIFRVVLNEPGELINIEEACGVRIGDELRPGAKIFCTSFDARYEGNSRMVLLCTFQFRNTPDASSSAGGADPKSMPPDVRPANWTTSTSLMEVPKRVWSPRAAPSIGLGVGLGEGQPNPVPDAPGPWQASRPAINPAGDMYDGVTSLEPIVTINITQFESTDPTRHLLYAGYVNSEEINLNSLKMSPGTVLFRGVSCEPTIESWGGVPRRGWNATYEFAYRRNKTKVNLVRFEAAFGGGVEEDVADAQDVDIGWDVAVPVAGFNCRAFSAVAPLPTEDVWGQPLRHTNGKVTLPLQKPENINDGDRVRAMVRVFEHEDGGVSQAPSASPIALNLKGSARKTHDANGNLINEPLVIAYKVQPDTNLTETLGLRLF